MEGKEVEFQRVQRLHVFQQLFLFKHRFFPAAVDGLGSFHHFCRLMPDVASVGGVTPDLAPLYFIRPERSSSGRLF